MKANQFAASAVCSESQPGVMSTEDRQFQFPGSYPPTRVGEKKNPLHLRQRKVRRGASRSRRRRQLTEEVHLTCAALPLLRAAPAARAETAARPPSRAEPSRPVPSVCLPRAQLQRLARRCVDQEIRAAGGWDWRRCSGANQRPPRRP